MCLFCKNHFSNLLVNYYACVSVIKVKQRRFTHFDVLEKYVYTFLNQLF